MARYKRILIVSSWSIIHIKRILGLLDKATEPDFCIDFLDTSMSSTSDYGLMNVNVTTLYKNKVEIMFSNIPKIRVYVNRGSIKKTLNCLLREKHYNVVNFIFLPNNIHDYVRICDKYSVKSMLSPAGSDILRCPSRYLKSMQDAFNSATYISIRKDIGFYNEIRKRVLFDEDKVVGLSFGSNVVSSILKLKNTISKEQMFEFLGIPQSSFVICCGYNGYKEQRHSLMLKAIAANKEYLPNDYLVIVPLTYGDETGMNRTELENLSFELALNTRFLCEYLSDDQVACLRLLTDLFIHIQTTDAYNGSLQEFLLADTECINGSWLSYPTLEKNGLPYYSLQTIDSLDILLYEILNHKLQKPIIHPDVIKEIESNSWNERIKQWVRFYEDC